MKEETLDGDVGWGFRAATQAAVDDYERKRGTPEKPVTLRVIEMSMTAHNPIHGFHVVLGPGG